MKSNQSLEDKIEQYLLGRLPRDEHLEMEQAIREQPDLAQEIELRRLEFDTAEELIAGDIRAQFERLHEQEPESGKMSPRWDRRWYYYVAVAVVVLLAFLLYRQLWTNNVPPPLPPNPLVQDTVPQNPLVPKDAKPSTKPHQPKSTPTSVQHIASAYYKSSQNWKETSAIRGDGATGLPDAVDRAIAFWQNGEYRKTLQHLENVQIGHPRFYTAQLLRTHAYFNLRNYNEAAAAARSVMAWQGNAEYSEEAEWLLVLTFVADGKNDTDEFKVASDNILRDKAHPYHDNMLALWGNLPENKNAAIALADPTNFVTSPSMEAFVVASSRSQGLTVKISSPPNDTRFAPDKNGEVLIRFAGTVESAPGVTLTLMIFDNKNANKPLVSVPLELKKGNVADTLSFDFQQRLKVAQGLYYFTVERQGMPLAYTGKFTIKN